MCSWRGTYRAGMQASTGEDPGLYSLLTSQGSLHTAFGVIMLMGFQPIPCAPFSIPSISAWWCWVWVGEVFLETVSFRILLDALLFYGWMLGVMNTEKNCWFGVFVEGGPYLLVLNSLLLALCSGSLWTELGTMWARSEPGSTACKSSDQLYCLFESWKV